MFALDDKEGNGGWRGWRKEKKKQRKEKMLRRKGKNPALIMRGYIQARKEAWGKKKNVSEKKKKKKAIYEIAGRTSFWLSVCNCSCVRG